MAEYLLRDRLQEMGVADVIVESAGFLTEGNPPCPVAAGMLAAAGTDMTGHRSRIVTRAMLEKADMVLGMEKRHLGLAMDLSPSTIKRMALLAKYIRGREKMEIPDPYGKSPEDYRQALELIREGVEALAHELAGQAPGAGNVG